MSLANILTKLSTIGGTVTGISASYDVDALPESLNTADLPALLHFPQGGEDQLRVFRGGNFWVTEHSIRVVLVYDAAAQGNLEQNLNAIVDLVDLYITKIHSDQTLTNSCVQASLSYGGAGVFNYAGVDYHSVDFTISAIEYRLT